VKLPGPQQGPLLGGILLIQGASELIGTDGMTALIYILAGAR
jgi:hypothetical protein